MPDWSVRGGGQRTADGGAVPASSRGTAVTSGAVHTKGAWVTLLAATAFDAQGLLVHMGDINEVTPLLDIGLGAAGAEVVLIPNLRRSGRAGGSSVYFPVAVPAGTRLSARVQSPGASSALYVNVTLFAQGLTPSSPLSRVTSYGEVLSLTSALALDPGGVANTKGAWVELVGATTSPIRELLVSFAENNQFSSTSCSWLVDFGLGAAGAEVVLLPDIGAVVNTTTDIVLPTNVGPLPLDLPAGVRLAVRAQCSIIDPADRVLTVLAHGID